jgi:hypothetical protein
MATRWRGVAPLEAVEADHRDEPARARVPLAPSDAGELERECDVVDHRAPGKRRLFLEHHAECRVRAGNGFATDANAPLELGRQAADDVEERRLSAARRPDDRDELALLDGERHAVDSEQGVVTATETLDDVGDREERHRHGERAPISATRAARARRAARG